MTVTGVNTVAGASNGVNGAGFGTGSLSPSVNGGNDQVSRNIKRQIEDEQKKLQALSENRELSIEDKMKKRQEIQQQISSLQIELRQHQLEKQREERQQANSSEGVSGGSSGRTAGTGQGQSDTVGISAEGMRSLLSADASMQQVKLQGAAKSQLEGRARVLKAEIKQDGGDVSKKQEEAAEAEARAQNLEASQMGKIAEINNELKRAEESDREDKSGDEKVDITLDASDMDGELGNGDKVDITRDVSDVNDKTGSNSEVDITRNASTANPETGVNDEVNIKQVNPTDANPTDANPTDANPTDTNPANTAETDKTPETGEPGGNVDVLI